MIKRTTRAAIRLARRWLAEKQVGAPTIANGDAPFSYQRANQFFAQLAAEQDFNRPHYLWGALQSVNLAKALGLKRISFIEFGVAGGNGLAALEVIAQKLEDIFQVGIDTHGFGALDGLPKPQDYRDLPNIFREGFYPTKQEELDRRLKTAKLHIGLVEHTVCKFIESKPAPVAFISFDLDYYSSTKDAFKLLEAGKEILMPRIHCYFDDIMANTYSEFTGERLAIAEFNASSEARKLSPIFGLRYFLAPPYHVSTWPEMMFIAHIFDHDLYGCYDGLNGLNQETVLNLRAER